MVIIVITYVSIIIVLRSISRSSVNYPLNYVQRVTCVSSVPFELLVSYVQFYVYLFVSILERYDYNIMIIVLFT